MSRQDLNLRLVLPLMITTEHLYIYLKMPIISKVTTFYVRCPLNFLKVNTCR